MFPLRFNELQRLPPCQRAVFRGAAATIRVVGGSVIRRRKVFVLLPAGSRRRNLIISGGASRSTKGQRCATRSIFDNRINHMQPRETSTRHPHRCATRSRFPVRTFHPQPAFCVTHRVQQCVTRPEFHKSIQSFTGEKTCPPTPQSASRDMPLRSRKRLLALVALRLPRPVDRAGRCRYRRMSPSSGPPAIA